MIDNRENEALTPEKAELRRQLLKLILKNEAVRKAQTIAAEGLPIRNRLQPACEMQT